MSTGQHDKEIELRAAVYGILSEALNQGVEGRKRLREPFLAHVFVQPEGESGPSLTAFSRDISVEGIGLLHSFALEPKDNVVVVFSPTGKPTNLEVEIAWCKPFGEGWYVSGGRFIGSLNA